MSLIEIGAYALVCTQQHNLWLYNIYLSMQMPLMVWLVRDLSGSAWLRRSALIALPLSIGALLFEQSVLDVRVDLLAGTAVVNDALLSILFTWVLFEIAGNEHRPVLRDPRFWVAFAHLLYFGCTLPLTGLLNHLNHRNVALASQLYVLQDVIYMFYYGIIIWLCTGPLRRWEHHAR
ncbi:MAG: hypothetical protein ABI599_07875 [Flavobacteriales bacterium]